MNNTRRAALYRRDRKVLTPKQRKRLGKKVGSVENETGPYNGGVPVWKHP